MKIKLSFIKLTIFSSLIWLNYQHTVSASGIVNHIQVNTFIEKGYQFDVKRFDDRNPKQYVFSIQLTPKLVEMPSQFTASIGLIRTARQSWSQSISIKPLRKVVCQTELAHLLCKFTVPKQSLFNPELGFIFEVPGSANVNTSSMRAPLANIGYFKLKDVSGT